MKGKLLIFSAPSGSGKTTIVKYLLDLGLNLEFSISATSRNPRNNEKDGIDYFFMSAEDFRKKIAENLFVEWEEVYSDHYYGTLKSELERIWKNGNHVLFDIDVSGGLALKNQFGSNAISFFIKPPSLDEIRNRLAKRGTDPAEKIEMRLEKAASEMATAELFDHIILNDNLEEACRTVEKIVRKAIS